MNKIDLEDLKGNKNEYKLIDFNCYLTTACMNRYLDKFDNKCYELMTLRWFRDNYLSEKDIDLYYKTAPIIVEGIEKEDNKEQIYNYIYENVIDACVKAIELQDYNFAYNRCKNSIISLQETYDKSEITKKSTYLKKPKKHVKEE